MIDFPAWRYSTRDGIVVGKIINSVAEEEPGWFPSYAVFAPHLTIVEIGPKAVPLEQTDESACDFWIHELQIVNDGDGPATVCVYDRQNPPVPMIPATVLEKGGMLSANSARGRSMPGGFSWKASAPGVHGWIVGTQR
jgi:hypothetical protein